MRVYVFDTSSLSVLKNFYPLVFPSFWENLEEMVLAGEVISVEEVMKELDRGVQAPHLADWVAENRGIFEPPTEGEMFFVREIFAVPHFQQLVSQDRLLRGGFVADPWVIARAESLGGCVVTEERHKPNAAKIPNVCRHFNIDCCNMRELLESKGWRF